MPTVRENLQIDCMDQEKMPRFPFLNSPPLLGKFPKRSTEVRGVGVRGNVCGSDGERTHTVRRFSVAVFV